MKFNIEQIAIHPADPVAAKALLNELGAEEWHEDHVVAKGEVFGIKMGNEADLSFNYELIEGKEFELLNYTKGGHWLQWSNRGRNIVSHLGTHCTEEELLQWKEFFRARNIAIVQEVRTESHTNPAIAGKRSYNYVIFDTKPILGVDLKFIVRHIIEEQQPPALPMTREELREHILNSIDRGLRTGEVVRLQDDVIANLCPNCGQFGIDVTTHEEMSHDLVHYKCSSQEDVCQQEWLIDRGLMVLLHNISRARYEPPTPSVEE